MDKEDGMSITVIFRIALVGILVTMLNQILKQSGRDEIAFLTTLSGWILVILWVLPYITQLFDVIESLFAF